MVAILAWIRSKFSKGDTRTIKVGPDEYMLLTEWKNNLSKGEGLYAPLKGYEKLLKGPHLTKNYESLVGDADTVEDFIFAKHASPEQKDFFKKLWEANRHVAREYLFSVIGATPIWKRDIELFQHTLSLLRTGEVLLKEEEEAVKSLEIKQRMIKELPDALQRHFPDIMGNLKKDYNELDDLLADIEIALRKFSSREAMIDDHLTRLKATHPFLFEKT